MVAFRGHLPPVDVYVAAQAAAAYTRSHGHLPHPSLLGKHKPSAAAAAGEAAVADVVAAKAQALPAAGAAEQDDDHKAVFLKAAAVVVRIADASASAVLKASHSMRAVNEALLRRVSAVVQHIHVQPPAATASNGSDAAGVAAGGFAAARDAPAPDLHRALSMRLTPSSLQ